MNFDISKYKLVLVNASWLSALEVIRMAMPFIAMPYLIGVVGTENYGLVVWIQTIISYFTLVINFGLDVSAAKDVSVYRSDKQKLNEIVSSVLFIKIVIFLLSFCVLSFLTAIVPSFREHAILICFSFIACLSDVLFPIWYYQGQEKMKMIAVIRFFSIFFYTVSIFIFIRKQEDYVFIPLLQSLGLLLSGLISCYFMIIKDGLTLYYTGYKMVRSYFVDSIPFFLSRASVLINSSMAKIISGAFFSMSDVAAFDIVHKICQAALVPIYMFNQSLFPHFAKVRDRKMVLSCFRMELGTTLGIVLITFFFGGYATSYFSKGELPIAELLLKIQCLFLLASGVSIFTGSPVLVAFGHPRPFNVSVILSTFVLLFFYLLLYLLDAFSITMFALTLGLAETTIAVYRLYYCHHYKLINVFRLLGLKRGQI